VTPSGWQRHILTHQKPDFISVERRMSKTLPCRELDAVPVIFEKLNRLFPRGSVSDHATSKPCSTIRYLKRDRVRPTTSKSLDARLNLPTHNASSSRIQVENRIGRPEGQRFGQPDEGWACVLRRGRECTRQNQPSGRSLDMCDP